MKLLGKPRNENPPKTRIRRIKQGLSWILENNISLFGPPPKTKKSRRNKSRDATRKLENSK